MRPTKKINCLFLLLAFLPLHPIVSQKGETPRDILFDSGWKFNRGGAQGAERPAFDDSDWRQIDLPHDWSLEDLPGTESPFDINAISQVNGGFTTGGTGWYRKEFEIPAKSRDKRFILMFDGIYMNCEIWLNGRSVGRHPYGYTSFWFDVTDRLMIDTVNLLAVKVRNEGENSRWYSGSGIYRHVWLIVVPQVHVMPWGTFVTTPEISEKDAVVKIKTRVVNNDTCEKKVKLITRISDSNKSEIAKTESEEILSEGSTAEFTHEMRVANPRLWSVETPVL
ncbi:MAG TPA: beta galactosidase jelly roll domain-containing protein, partial [Bacteroidales bacterium]|nr:beta galactosidase jelly roll domain-containing protein [Bacteroidales bacterium]